MVVTLPLPLTLSERANAPDELRAAATFEEYLDFAAECEYNVDFYNNEIISMGQASLPHESLVTRLAYLLVSIFDEQEEYQVFGSNIKVHVPACVASFNADVTVIKGEPDYLRLPSGKFSSVEIQNPEIIVEILSKSTYNYDFGTKLSCYKTLASLKQVLFIDQNKVSVETFVRTNEPQTWLNKHFDSMGNKVVVLDNEILLKDIYKKMKF